MKRKQRILNHYEPRIVAGRENFDVLDWASAASQRARFSVLASNVNLPGKSLLDVGCGLGDLLGYLRNRGIQVEYTGADISSKMAETARRKHQDATFVCVDLFGNPQRPTAGPLDNLTFDVVFCSGIFNLNLGNNRQFLPAAVARLMDLADQYVVFNLLNSRTPHQDEHYAYYDPAEVLAAIRSDGWANRLVDGYLSNDFTVICRKIRLDTTG